MNLQMNFFRIFLCVMTLPAFVAAGLTNDRLDEQTKCKYDSKLQKNGFDRKQNEDEAESSSNPAKKRQGCENFCRRLLPSNRYATLSKNFWVEFNALSSECNALNLAQGFTDLPMPNVLSKHFKELAIGKMTTELHQYTRGYGHERLVNILAKFYSKFMNDNIDPETEILITIGAYNALHDTFFGWINEGDEVILIEPSYDSYRSQIKLAGGIPVPVPLTFNPEAETSAGFRIDFDLLRSKITAKTKMLVLTSPNNPTGKLFEHWELERLARIVEETNLLVLADEVHEWAIYSDWQRMIKFASLPRMYERTITIGSAGKAFTATGWRIGWAIAPKHLLEPLKRVHEPSVFMCCTPTQEALARVYEEEFRHIEEGNFNKSYLLERLPNELRKKRDFIARQLKLGGFKTILPDAGLFITFDIKHCEGPFRNVGCYRREGEGIDFGFARWLCREKGLSLIPLSAFKSPENRSSEDDHYMRLCFFKKRETLKQAASILKRLNIDKVLD